MSTATVQPSGGCTLAEYAAGKRLDPEFLRSLGLKDVRRAGLAALRIPYFAADGAEVSVRLRTALGCSATGDRPFRWRTGDKPIPYGLWRLGEARERGYVFIVEGESDAHTLWQHGIPALGLPGAASWREEWAEYLEGIATLYVVIEPDAGGQATEKWIAESAIRDRVRLISLDAAKDPSELYLVAPESFPAAWQAAMGSAVPWSQAASARQDAKHKRATALSASLAAAPDILQLFADALAGAGVVGEARAAKLLYLCLTSRLLERPVSAVLKGPSSAGKSFLCERVRGFFPPSAYYALSAMSERALAYFEESLEHRVLVLFEAAAVNGELGPYLLRSLLSEGRVRYVTVEKTRDGLRPRVIERPGPTGLLVTTTAIHLDAELETRLLAVPVTDSPEQTARVMRIAAEGERPAGDLAPWHALQEWLKGAEHRVVIPYATRLADLIPPAAVRLRRDFSAILNLIRAHAILHQASRPRDEAGQITATVEDYAAVRELVSDLVAEGIGAIVSPATRETVDEVRRVTEKLGGREVTVREVAGALGLDKSAASRRVRKALDEGYLKNLEDRRGRPARLALGEPLPEERQILPRPDLLGAESGCTVAEDSGGIDTTFSQNGSATAAGPAQPCATSEAPHTQADALNAGVSERLAAGWEASEAQVSIERAEASRHGFGTPSPTQGDLFGEGEP